MTRATSCREKVKDILFIILVFVLPPIPVGYRYGVRSSDFWINLLLSILFPLFALIHGVYILMLHPRPVAGEGYIPIDEEAQIGPCCNANEQPECSECNECCATQDATPTTKPMAQRPVGSEQGVQGASDSPSYNPPAYTETTHSATFDNKVQSAR